MFPEALKPICNPELWIPWPCSLAVALGEHRNGFVSTWVGRINAEEPQDMSVVCEMGEATVTSISLCQPQDLCTTLLGR